MEWYVSKFKINEKYLYVLIKWYTKYHNEVKKQARKPSSVFYNIFINF